MTRSVALCALLVLAAAPALARDPIRPAELPPPGFAGAQYIDSKGCAFVRAGTEGEVLWVPRVSRTGQLLCGNPPSGHRVPVAEEVGVQELPAAPESPAAAAPEASVAPAVEAVGGGYFVAVGSFGVPANADKAEARLRSMNYGVVRGRVQGASSALTTVYAGPFPDATTAEKARQELRGAGFPDATVMRP